ncbi:MAG: dihydrolipoamide acetyltransferase family protein [Candidatus Poseidoniaceae archaeon]|jgi:2-oxoisovalerate dehydrogenase E2 component (dihydrolipoyl transacylase)|nr:dihydrolipoamide acetyltransferase family protein [Candidatus Poseidoniaceae archaeon]MDP7203748.1 dihydrolipoamide acetyltransferase family protein [Candidatus Poseidoniaceae archaeon]
MGIYSFKLPDIGEGVVEGEVVAWHVEIGATVKEDDPVLDVMTDKATVTIPCPVDGTVRTRRGNVGEILPVGQTCITFEVEGEGNSTSEEEESEPVVEESAPEKKSKTKAVTPPAPSSRGGNSKPLASPAVRRRAKEEGLDLSKVSGSGPAGRITHEDLDDWKDAGSPVAAAGHGPREAKVGTTEIPVVGLRRKIAEQMHKSYSNIAHFSYFEDVDVTNLEELRQHLNSTRPEGAPKLTYLPFIMQALVKALSERPECNAHYDDEREVIIRHEAINLGIATQTERGLYVPVVKNVEAMDLWQTAAEMGRVTNAAKSGDASLEELSGSTFTITSLGKMGGTGATPIINHPEVGILGVHNASDSAVVRDGNIVIRRIMKLSSSWDHRVVDGFDGAMLVQILKNYLEHPATIFM